MPSSQQFLILWVIRLYPLRNPRQNYSATSTWFSNKNLTLRKVPLPSILTSQIHERQNSATTMDHVPLSTMDLVPFNFHQSLLMGSNVIPTREYSTPTNGKPNFTHSPNVNIDRVPCQICENISHQALDCFHHMDTLIKENIPQWACSNGLSIQCFVWRRRLVSRQWGQ